MDNKTQNEHEDDAGFAIGVISFILCILTPIMIGPEGMLIDNVGLLRYLVMFGFLSVSVLLIRRDIKKNNLRSMSQDQSCEALISPSKALKDRL